MSLRGNMIQSMNNAAVLLARVLVVAVAVSSVSAGCALDRTLALLRPSTDMAVTYRLIREPEAG